MTIAIIYIHQKYMLSKLNLRNSFVILFSILILIVIYCLIPLVIIEILDKNWNTIYVGTAILFSYSGLVTFFVLGHKYTKNQYDKEVLFNENKHKESLISMQKIYFESIMDNFKEIREFKHDILAHLNMILELSKENKQDELVEYVMLCLKKNDDKYLYQCSNFYINAIINSQRSTLLNNNIDFKLIYIVEGEIQINAFDLTSLFHNLFINAIEAVEKRNDKKVIQCKIVSKNTNLYIKIANSVSKDFNIQNIKKHISSKKENENHGIGTINIQNIVKKYNGIYEVSQENDIFITDIIVFDVINRD